MKFQRVYKARLTLQTGSLEIDSPFTMIFSVNRNTLASANTGHFQFINLSRDTQQKIFKDRWDTTKYTHIQVNAGYADDKRLPTIFDGDIREAYSHRSGTEWITEIEAFDGGDAIQNGIASLSQPSGYQLSTILRTMVGNMVTGNGNQVAVGAITQDLPQGSSRGLVVDGNAYSEMQKLVGDARVFIDNGRIHILHDGEYVNEGQAVMISADTGLLETPTRSETRIDLPMLFEPRIQVGHLVQVQSISPVYNGLKVVQGVQHRGIISQQVDGETRTIVSVWQGATLTPVTPG